MHFKLTILGSGSALPTIFRNTTAQVLNILERFFIIDCGEGCQQQLRKYSIPFSKINHIFISHLHGDHFFGLFGLLSTLNLMGRKNTLYIYAHQELKSILNTVLNFEQESWSYKIEIIPLSAEEQILFEDKKIRVSSFPLRHSIPTCGFLFEEKVLPRNICKSAHELHQFTIKEINELKAGFDITRDNITIPNNSVTIDPPAPRKYAFASDTLKCSSIVKKIQGADLFYHEATYLHSDLSLARQTCHSTAIQAAQIAQAANVKKLLIGHYSSRYTDPKILEDEARTIFSESYATHDGDVFEIDVKK